MERNPSQILLQLDYLLYRILVTLGVLFFLNCIFPKVGFWARSIERGTPKIMNKAKGS